MEMLPKHAAISPETLQESANARQENPKPVTCDAMSSFTVALQSLIQYFLTSGTA